MLQLQHSPRGLSCYKNGLGISGSTFSTITSKELRRHPYQIPLHHELSEGDFIRRINF